MKALITTTVELRGYWDLVVDGYVNYTLDTRYGEDVDGNRGTKKICVISVDDVAGYEPSGDKIILTNEEEGVASEAITRKFLEG